MHCILLVEISRQRMNDLSLHHQFSHTSSLFDVIIITNSSTRSLSPRVLNSFTVYA
jgi:hypothetical protein